VAIESAQGLSPRQELFRRFYLDRPLAHEVLFRHRHPHATPAFHREMIQDFHSQLPRVMDMVFRGGAKSTIAEEAVCLMAGFREFKNALFVGSNKDRAMERLHSVRKEVESNDTYRKLFGDLMGPTWADDELVFANGRRILALGRGQSLRGTKWEDIRPDLIFADDLEERAEAWTKEGRLKVYHWFTRDLIPAGDVGLRVRVDATPLHPEALPMRLKRDPEWVVHTYPIYYPDLETGEPTSSWPDRFPIEEVLKLEKGFRASGDHDGFMSEYMCQSESPETKPFKKEMVRIEPRVRTWQAVYSMHDPARTVGPQAATTGFAAWSWLGPKLVIWDAWARRLMPDQIVDSLFDTYDHHHPVWEGFEEDGLNQWALQPIRQAQVTRGITLPIKAVKAPKGKIDFIRGLQPFFQAREAEFAKPLPELEEQLLGFPSGDIDAPNALAYALKMRPGAPIYDSFRGSHIAEDIRPVKGQPLWLCLNATRVVLTAVVAQVFDGAVRIFGDGVWEGDPAQVLNGAVAEMQVKFGRDLKLTAGPDHFHQYHNVGLIAAASRIPREVSNGVASERGRPWIEEQLERDRHGLPCVMVSSEAAWTLNAFTGGYSRALLKQGILADYAEEGIYRVLMEGLESFTGLLDLGLDGDGGRGSFNAETAQGRPYRSMLAGANTVRESKSDWNRLLRGER
jgi:hypothetical protein